MARKRRIPESELVRVVDDLIDIHFRTASDADAKRDARMARFLVEPREGDEVDSLNYQSADINNMTTAVMAQAAISFGQDHLVEFEANGETDKAAAGSETAAINTHVMEANLGYMAIMEAVQNALVLDNGYLKAGWDEKIIKTRVTHNDVRDDAELGALIESDQPGVTRELVSWKDGEAVVETTVRQKRLGVYCVADGDMVVPSDYTGQSMADIPFCAEIHHMTRAECVEMGMDEKLVRELPTTFRDEEGKEQVRKQNQEQLDNGVQRASEIVRVYECYARLQVRHDEMSLGLYRCWTGDGSGDKFLKEPEPVQRVPYAKGTAFPVANRFRGEGLGAKLSSIQDSKTVVVRNWIDNVALAGHGRISYVRGQVDEEDLLSPRPAQAIATKRPDAIAPIPVVDVGGSAALLLDKLDGDRTERGGAAVDFLANESQFAQDTASGTERVYGSKEILVGYMMRNLAETLVREIYLLVHAELREGSIAPISVEIAGQWQQVDPRRWPVRTHVNVKPAATAGEKTRRGIVMQALIQLYREGLQAGLNGVMGDYGGLYDLVLDFARNANLDSPEKYYIDPRSPEAQQAMQAQQQAAQEQQAFQVQIVERQQKMEQAFERWKVEQETTFKYFKEILEATLEASKVETGALSDAIIAETQAAATRNAGSGDAGGTGKGDNRGAPGRSADGAA